MTASLQELFTNNRRWAEATESREPGFFSRLLEQQAPQYLWIGCADSRVPANELVGLLPGELFVHRNVANVVVHSDLNCLSVLQFAVDALRVRHIIVVGHSGCGGVKAALQDLRVGLVDNWLRHVQDVRNKHQVWLDSLPAERRVDALCELNVLEQSVNACRTTVVRDAWARGQGVAVHGWVYGLHNGLIDDLHITVAGPEEVLPAYERALAGVKARHERAAQAAQPPAGQPQEGLVLEGRLLEDRPGQPQEDRSQEDRLQEDRLQEDRLPEDRLPEDRPHQAQPYEARPHEGR